MHPQYWASILLALVQTSCCHFGYSKRSQHTWSQSDKYCGGESQSPIALSTSKSAALPLPAIEMIGYHDLLSGPINMTNNGHSVALSMNKKLSKKRLPFVFGGLLNKGQEYELEGLHFHWGMKNSRGSEHILNGVRFPMEMHIIHRNMKYDFLSEALQHADGLTVLGIFFQLQDEDNENLYPLLRTFPEVQWANTVVRLNSSITLASLLPHDTEMFYTYRGSLTTPPCNEAVTWNIFSTPVPISFRQINKFRMLSNGEDILADNYRQLQEIGHRKVYVRRMESYFASSEKMIDLDVESLKWYWS